MYVRMYVCMYIAFTLPHSTKEVLARLKGGRGGRSRYVYIYIYVHYRTIKRITPDWTNSVRVCARTHHTWTKI